MAKFCSFRIFYVGFVLRKLIQTFCFLSGKVRLGVARPIPDDEEEYEESPPDTARYTGEPLLESTAQEKRGKFKVLLRSNYRYSFFYIFVYNMTFLHILPNFNPLRTLKFALFGLLFSRIYGRRYLTL